MTENKKDKIIEISYSEMFDLLKEAYRHGFSTKDMVEAGLETYDPEGYVRWVLLKYNKN